MTLMVLAMKAKVGNPLRKLVLIKLADNANDKGECWPSYQHIADQCEVARSTVRKHIKDLEHSGLLRIENRKGPKGNTSNLYHLTLHPVPSEITPVPSNSTGGVPSDSTRTYHSSEPINEPKEATSKKPVARACQIPTDWKPNQKHLETCLNNNLDANDVTEHFRDHHLAKGSTMKDWDAAFRTWLRNAAKFNKPSQRTSQPTKSDMLLAGSSTQNVLAGQPLVTMKQGFMSHD
tara:strand:- start:3620 stop:4321 length:702 start_codon:yes stop_codon:yes gene_type:complete